MEKPINEMNEKELAAFIHAASARRDALTGVAMTELMNAAKADPANWLKSPERAAVVARITSVLAETRG